jgi:hypothetical protein
MMTFLLSTTLRVRKRRFGDGNAISLMESWSVSVVSTAVEAQPETLREA